MTSLSSSTKEPFVALTAVFLLKLTFTPATSLKEEHQKQSNKSVAMAARKKINKELKQHNCVAQDINIFFCVINRYFIILAHHSLVLTL